MVLEVRINGALKQTVTFDQLVRTPRQLLADVGEFMTLAAGDALMLGVGADRPRARAGDSIQISCPELGSLSNRLVAEGA
jgi:5-oxopent-3-ene-1,2,5-tricarboxylate decarboxylase/2-hydroxyhepta-2,4-diene-1,7-dioate isomerase